MISYSEETNVFSSFVVFEFGSIKFLLFLKFFEPLNIIVSFSHERKNKQFMILIEF